MKKIFILTKMLYISASFAQDGKVGINTTSPSETLEVAGTAKIKELPQNNQGNIYNGTPQKDTPFKATRTVVANDSGVLGYVEGTPQDIDTNTTYTPGEGIIINDNNVISRSGLEAVYRQDGKKSWRLIGSNVDYHDEIGEGAIDLNVNVLPRSPKGIKPALPPEEWKEEVIDFVKPGAIGRGSIAIGDNNHARTTASTSIGRLNYSANGGVAIGISNTGVNSGVAIGLASYASDRGVALGRSNSALGEYSVSIGYGNIGYGVAIGLINKSSLPTRYTQGYVFGQDNIASGDRAFAFGIKNKVSGDESFGVGSNTEAVSRGATALGIYTRANIYGQLVAGFFNFNTDSDDHTSNLTYSRDEKELFVLGNGLYNFEKFKDPDPTKFDRQNAFIVLRNGKTGIGVAKRKPTEMLEVAGAVKIDNGGYDNISDRATTPEPSGGAGTMVFHNGHFYGWNGEMWKQLDN